MLAPAPQLELLCSHRRAPHRDHLAVLARLRAELEQEGLCRPVDGAGPLVLLSCGGERGAAPARWHARRHADSSVEIVHVRLDGAPERAQARRLARGALRFAAAAGAAQAPRRGVLAAFARTAPLAVLEERCAGSPGCELCAGACPKDAIQFGARGRPVVQPGACDLCGRCVARCPRGAWGWAHAPWPALLGRLEALLAPVPAGEPDGPVALLLVERARPPGPDEPRETEQPASPWVLPLEAPAGTLDAAIVLRALELGADAVCAVPARHAPAGAGRLDAADAVARAIGAGGAVRTARSAAEGLVCLAERPPPRSGRAPVAIDVRCRPDAAAVAERLWRGAAVREVVRFRGAGAFAGRVAVEAPRCTLCDRCTRACPSGALALRRDGGGLALVFAGRRCPGGCGLCARACPQGALTAWDEVRVPAREAVLVAPRPSSCPSCGAPWSGAPAVPALEQRWDEKRDNEALRTFLSECPSCRRWKLAASLRTRSAPGVRNAPFGAR